MPSAMASLPEIKPKSSRRFLHFSSPFGSLSSLTSSLLSVPPMPSFDPDFGPQPSQPSHPSSALGSGATIVRRPSDARREMKTRSLSPSAAGALSRSLTRTKTGGVQAHQDIHISPPMPYPYVPILRGASPKPSVRSSTLTATRTSDGSYTSGTSSSGTDSTGNDSFTLQTPVMPERTPRSAMRKTISPQVSMPNLSFASVAPPNIHAGRRRDGHVHGHGHAPSIDSLASWRSNQSIHRRSTLKPSPRDQPKGSLPPPVENALTPFHAISRGVSRRGDTTGEETILVKINFGYSLAASHDTSQVIIPWCKILPLGGGAFVRFIHDQLRLYRSQESNVPTKSSGASGPGGQGASYAESVSSEYEDECGEELLCAEAGMTNGENVEGGGNGGRDSEYGLTTLLRDEYLKSLWSESPTKLDFTKMPPPMPITHAYPTPPKHRAKTRNQYVQKGPLAPLGAKAPSLPPLPSNAARLSLGPTAPLQIRRSPSWSHCATPASVMPRTTQSGSLPTESPIRVMNAGHMERKAEGSVVMATGKAILEVHVLLLRDAEAYHSIAHRLISGNWPAMDHHAKAKKIEEELRWLGFDSLTAEFRRSRSAARGVEGYI